MLTDGTGANGLAFVYDEASEQDSLDDNLMRSWAHGVRSIGKKQWMQTLRVALRPYGETPWTAKQCKEKTDELLGLLRQRGIQAAIVMQSPATPGVRQVHSAWNMLGHSGNPYKWAGTAERRHDLYVCPVLATSSYEYVWGYLLEKWIRQAYELATNKITPLVWSDAELHPGPVMYEQMQAMLYAKKALAVDIETNMAGTIVTAIGLSNGIHTISCPWHGYAIANTDGQRQRGLLTYPHGAAIADTLRAILQHENIPKILHNGAFDVLQLAKHGITLSAFTFDTLLLHRVAYPQFRHALQMACATEFCVEPWKTLWRPPKVSTGEDAWLSTPTALRTYNSKDTYATYKLAQSLASKVEVSFP